MANPVDAVAGYWQQVIGTPAAASLVLGELRSAIADASEAGALVQGSGTAADPWRLALIGPLQLEAYAAGAKLNVGLAATTSVDTLGQRCTVITTRFAPASRRSTSLAAAPTCCRGSAAVPAGRERGINPPRARLCSVVAPHCAPTTSACASRGRPGLAPDGGSERTEPHARGRRLRRRWCCR
jgi:hypothetical protein